MNGGFGRLADVHTGQTARITYVRADGAYVAELIEVTEAPPASSVPTEAAREASGIESRKRYLEDAARTLGVLEESLGELRQYPDIDGADELERLNRTVEELEIKLSDAKALHPSPSATASQKAWRRGVNLLSAAIEDKGMGSHDPSSRKTPRVTMAWMCGFHFKDEPKVWMTATMPGRACDSSTAAAIISRTVS